MVQIIIPATAMVVQDNRDVLEHGSEFDAY